MKTGLMLLALIYTVSACQKDDDSKVSSAKLENGFYLDDPLCQNNQDVVGTYISGDNVAFAHLYVTPEACDQSALSDADVIAYGLEPAGTWSDFVKEVAASGFSVSVDSGAISIVDQATGEKLIRKKYLDPLDRNKEVTMSVTELKIEKKDDLRNINLRVSVNGPELIYEPSMWCESSVEEGNLSRLGRVEFQATSPSFTLLAVVNDPSDDDRYTFPARCQVSIGILTSIRTPDSVSNLVDIAFGNKISVD